MTVEIDLSPYMGKVEKVNITLPQFLLDRIYKKSRVTKAIIEIIIFQNKSFVIWHTAYKVGFL